MRTLLIIVGAVVALALVAFLVATRTESGQNALMNAALAARVAEPPNLPQRRHASVHAGRPRRCRCAIGPRHVAILADERIYVVDAGMASHETAVLAPFALENLRAIFVTHYHSDHIADIPEFNLMSWVAAGRNRCRSSAPAV